MHYKGEGNILKTIKERLHGNFFKFYISEKGETFSRFFLVKFF